MQQRKRLKWIAMLFSSTARMVALRHVRRTASQMDIVMAIAITFLHNQVVAVLVLVESYISILAICNKNK